MAKVFTSFQNVSFEGPAAVCLGNFDGVHRGHRKILEACLSMAESNGLEPVVFSFEPHPRKFFTKGRQPSLLMTRDEKIELLGRLGFTHILLQEFTEEFSKMSKEEFISSVLIQGLRTKLVVVGKDFRFGYQARGGSEDLKNESSFETSEQNEVIVGQQKISSSWIRRLVELGDLQEANEALGYPYFLSGKVVRGAGRGASQLGFPTVNISSEKECLPGRAVYLSLLLDFETEAYFPSVTNIGTRPTFSGQTLSIESHLLDTQDDFYDREVRIFLLQKLRDEQKFSSVEALQEQIAKDVDRARERFQNMKLLHTGASTMKWSLASPPAAAQAFQAFDF